MLVVVPATEAGENKDLEGGEDGRVGLCSAPGGGSRRRRPSASISIATPGVGAADIAADSASVRATPVRSISGVSPHGVPSPGVVLADVVVGGCKKAAPVLGVRSGGGASKNTLPETPSSCGGPAVGACHRNPPIHSAGGAPIVVEDEAGVLVIDGEQGAGVEVVCVGGGTWSAVAAVAGSRRDI